jgi:hypothetical protein
MTFPELERYTTDNIFPVQAHLKHEPDQLDMCEETLLDMSLLQTYLLRCTYH